jgi:hypothetical protein
MKHFKKCRLLRTALLHKLGRSQNFTENQPIRKVRSVRKVICNQPESQELTSLIHTF